MNKTELINIVAKKVALPKTKCEQVLEVFKSTIIEGLKKGEEISIKNFGKFKVVEKAERRCVNPITKRSYISKPKKVTIFRGFKNFKQCVK